MFVYANSNQFNIEGFYFGFGSGFNITSNANLIKTFSNDGVTVQSQNMGNVTGYSIPVTGYLGYRFNNYFSTEFTYVYSGNQDYTKPSNQTFEQSNFWGSQNLYTINAVGYYPLLDNNLYLKGRIGVALAEDTMTTYIGSPGTGSFTSSLGIGLQYYIAKFISLDLDYINYGLLVPAQLTYKPSISPPGPNLGVVDTVMNNQFLLSINLHF